MEYRNFISFSSSIIIEKQIGGIPMKKSISCIILFCMVLLCLTACSVNETMELPVLTVGESIEAKPGARSWNVKQGFGKWMSQDASTVFPLDFPDDYPSLLAPQDGVVTLSWDKPPDTYSVAYWNEEVWSDGMEAIMTEAQLCGQGFILPEEDTSAIVAVRAIWEKQLLCHWYGDVEYIFKIVPSQ